MSITTLWAIFWLLLGCSLCAVAWLLLTELGAARRWWSAAVELRRERNAPVAFAPIAQEFLRSQTRIGRLKRRDAVVDLPAVGQGASEWKPRGCLAALLRRGDQGAAWFGRINLVIAVLAATVAVRGVIWEQQRHPPLPPHATQILETAIGALARQTSFRVPESVESVRAFYDRELPLRGWRYCGLQDTPGCSNLPVTAFAHEIAVYRGAEDPTFGSKTIEIRLQRDPAGQTFVTVSETRPVARRRQ